MTPVQDEDTGEDIPRMMRHSRERSEETARGRDEIMAMAVEKAPAPTSLPTRRNFRFKKIVDIMKDKAKSVLHGKRFSGSSFYETIFSMSSLPPEMVSIGTENLYDALREPNSRLLDLVNWHRRHEFGDVEDLTVEECLADISILEDAINALRIPVTLDKSPVNRGEAIQVRILHVHRGRGIGLHPTQTKAFTADFDGDPAVLNTDWRVLDRYGKALERLVGTDGKILVDIDFFPHDFVPDRGAALEALKGKYFSWAPSIADRLIDPYVSVCNESVRDENGDKDKKKENDLWVSLFRTIDEIADEYAEFDPGKSREEIAGDILMALYDFSTDMKMFGIASSCTLKSSEDSDFNPPKKGLEPVVYAMIDETDMIVYGKPPMNLMEFVAFMNKYYGEVDARTNVPYRLLADYANAINRSDLITVGSDLFGYKLNRDGNAATISMAEDPNAFVSVQELWEFSVVASLTKMISGKLHSGSREMAVSTAVRTMVLKDCPIPNNIGSENFTDDDFRGWIYKFISTYNFNMKLLHLAEASFTGGMVPSRKDELKFPGVIENFDGLETALIKVYGQYTLGRILPKAVSGNNYKENTSTQAASHYKDIPISVFAMNNRLVFNYENGKAKNEAISERLRKGTFTQSDIMFLIADQRTKQSSEYRKKWFEMTEGHFDAIGSVTMYQGKDRMTYADEVMETIQLMSPDMFLFFNMDSPARFQKSKWGKKLAAATTVGEYRSILFSMQIEYRLGRSAQILKEIEELDPSEDGNTQRIEDLNAAYESELAMLASSSIVWETIVKEAHNGNATYHYLISTRGEYKSGSVPWHLYAKSKYAKTEEEKDDYSRSFWDREEDIGEKYPTLLSLLKSNEPVEVKEAVLADVVKVSSGYQGIQSNEILGQLAFHPERMHAGSRFDMDGGIRSDIDALKESFEATSSYRMRTPQKIRENADTVIRRALDSPTGFEKFLQRMADDPGFAVYVDPILAADAVASVFYKTYNDKEKIKQQARVNGYFGAVSYQRSGGYYTHLYMTDNAVLNVCGTGQLTSFDIVRILAYPDLEITVTDEFGTPATISRRVLCGGDTISDVIRYLDENPRVALCCRRYIAGVSDDVNGTARINAVNDGRDFGDKSTDRVFALLDDRPRFLALSALLTETEGKSDESANGIEYQPEANIPDLVDKRIKALCRFVAYEVGRKPTDAELRKDIEEILGVEYNRLMGIHLEGRFDPTEVLPSDERLIRNLCEEVFTEVRSCIDCVRNSGIPLPNERIDDVKDLFGTDKSGIIAYFDAKQQLSGARTDVMIGIEGSETKKNLVFKEFLRSFPDKYTMSEDGTEVVPVSIENPAVSDQSLIHGEARRISSVRKFLEIKREYGAETFNAMVKKFGDDLTNSIIKFIRTAFKGTFSRYGKDTPSNMKNGVWSIEDAADLRQRILSCSKKEDAVPILAEALIEADIRLGYIDVNKDTGLPDDAAFIRSDYWNRADLMIGENTDGTLVIRTLEQLSAACRMRLSDTAVASGDADLVASELSAIVDSVGTDRDPYMQQQSAKAIAESCISGMPMHSSAGNFFRYDRALSPHTASTERNYELMERIYDRFLEDMGIEKVPRYTRDETGAFELEKYKKDASDLSIAIRSRKDIERISKRNWSRLESTDPDVAKVLEGLVYPKVYDKQNADFKGSYDFIGFYTDDFAENFDEVRGRNGAEKKEARFIPGPNSLIMFDEPLEGVDKEKFTRVLKRCRDYGMTAAFTGKCVDALKEADPEAYNNLVLVGYAGEEGNSPIYILPCFNMMLNGFFGQPMMSLPTQRPVNPDNLTVTVISTTGEFKPGDSSGHATKELCDRASVNFDGTAEFGIEDLFPNALATFPTSDIELDYCTKDEISSYFRDSKFNPETGMIEGFRETAVDIGVKPYIDEEGLVPNPDFIHEAHRFDIRLQEYLSNLDVADAEGFLTTECRPDSIVGFVKIKIKGKTNAFVLAPVWAFHLEQSGSVPMQYVIKREPTEGNRAVVDLDKETSSFRMGWQYSGGISDGCYAKFYLGPGMSSTKLIISTVDGYARSCVLGCGLSADIYVGEPSIGSRLFPINKRISSMVSVMLAAQMNPKYGYNFGSIDGAFPDHPEIAEELSQGKISMERWKQISETPGLLYHTDPEINDLVKFWVDRCLQYGTVNPCTFLATRYGDVNSFPQTTEWEAFFDPGYNFQNAWMKTMHRMSPNLVPESIEAPGDGYAFFCMPNSPDSDYGVLMTMVPTPDGEGNMRDVPQLVLINEAFFGDDFSGIKKPNFNAAERSLDDLNVASHLEGDDLIQLLTFGRSAISDVPSTNGIEFTPPDSAMRFFPVVISLEKDNKLGFGSLDGLGNDPVHKRILTKKNGFNNVLALTGHRPTPDKKTGISKLWGFDADDKFMDDPRYKAIGDDLVEYCIDYDIDTVVTGMALGFDQIGAQAIIDAKADGRLSPDFKLVAAVPMPGQENAWKSKATRRRYRQILAHADHVVYVSSEPAKEGKEGKKDASEKMNLRNEWMMAQADDVYALWDGSKGGTANAVGYSKSLGKKPTVVTPRLYDQAISRSEVVES